MSLPLLFTLMAFGFSSGGIGTQNVGPLQLSPPFVVIRNIKCRWRKKEVVDRVNEAPIGMYHLKKYEDHIGFTWHFILYFCVGQ